MLVDIDPRGAAIDALHDDSKRGGIRRQINEASGRRGAHIEWYRGGKLKRALGWRTIR